MAATIFGIDEITPQPGFSARQSDQGGWVANHEFAIRADDFDDAQTQFIKGTLLADLDPSIPDPFSQFLKIVDTEISRVEGDLIFLRVTASGSAYPQYDGPDISTDALPTYTLTGQLTDVPFSKHPKWNELLLGDQTLLGMMLDGILTYDMFGQILYLNNDANAQVAYVNQFSTEAENDYAKQFAKRIQQGQTTFQKSTYTWQESSEGDMPFPPEQLKDLGLIAVPRGEPPMQESGDYNWMMTNVSQSQTGELYRTNIEWTLSDEFGHDDFLYTKEQIG